MRRAIFGTVAAGAAALMLSVTPALAAAATAPAAPELAVTGASLIVAKTGQRLWSENGNSELAIASTTKLMTVLVTLQHITDLSEVFTQGPWEDQPGDSQIGLVPGEKMTVRDLIVAALVPSADDAAWDLAYNIGGGSITRFVAMMNAEARKLGLRHTHYSTPTGLDTPGNYSSPTDLVRLADYDMHHSAFFRQTVKLQKATIMVGDDPQTVTNTDTLLGAVPWIDGIKTGHTADAGYVLVSQGTRDGLTLIGSVLGTDSEAERNASALTLLEYGFASFHQISPLREHELMGKAPVAYSSRPVRLITATGYSSVVSRTAKVRVKTTLPHKLAGPLAKGAVVGHARVYVGNKLAADVPVVLSRALPAVSGFTKVGHFLKRAFTLVLLALIVGAAVALVGRRRRPRILAAGQMEER